MRQQAAEQVNLVRHQTARRNISHLRLVLQLPINLLLIAPALVEARHFARGRCLVSDNHLELTALLHRLKQVQLDRALLLDSNGVADENEPALLSPALGFKRLSKYWLLPPDPGTCHHSRRFSIRSLSRTKRSKGTEIVYSTPSFSRHCTIASLKKALSMRTSSRANGRRSRIDLTQVVTYSTAPLESCTLPARCNTSST